MCVCVLIVYTYVASQVYFLVCKCIYFYFFVNIYYKSCIYLLILYIYYIIFISSVKITEFVKIVLLNFTC